MKNMRCLVLALTITVVAACSQGPAYQAHTLPSGKVIKILGVTKMIFTEGDPALVLKYQTDLPINDIPGLSAEADEIWPTFRVDVEKAGLSNGAISANTPQAGFIIKTSKAHTFVYTKDQRGSWSKSDE